MRVIVAGAVYVDPDERDRFVVGHRELVRAARQAPGCRDVSISPDSVEEGRVNLFEDWESAQALEAWRAVAPSPTGGIGIIEAEVFKHDIAHSGPPFD